jgi:uncharacterized membrane protein YbhN (UPF0104 family)
MQRLALRTLTTLKPFFRWFILGATIVFLADHLRRYGAEMLALPLTPSAYRWIALGLGLTIAAHGWAGVAWAWILHYLNYPQSYAWATQVYLSTNIAKYLPGNIWHFVARVRASQTQRIPLRISILSVGLEAFLMMAAALILALGSPLPWGIRILGLGMVLGLLHPRFLSPVLQRLERSKRQQLDQLDPDQPVAPLDQTTEPQTVLPYPWKPYPWKPLGGEFLFVLLRSLGFLTIVLSLYPLPLHQIGSLISGFSVAWVLGLVVPGAPGGLGVFEATAILLLDGLLPASIVLATVTIYRVISTLAEAIGAGLVKLVRSPQSHFP